MENFGRCKAGSKIKYAKAMLYYNEEPCISGEKGSGNVFFSNCNMSCIYCQNYKISHEGIGKEVSIEELAEIFIDLQSKGANNINLVTAVMYVPQIIEALKIAKEKGLIIPIVYNSSGYESVSTIKMLDGYIDVYLPDFKYYDNALAKEFSGINGYFEKASEAIKEMYYQVGPVKLDENGIITKGVVIRHLILPECVEDSKKILKWIKHSFDSNVLISVMAQYFPCYKAKENKKINKKITKEELSEIEKYLDYLNLENGYIQDLEAEEERYVPNFEE